LTSEPIDENTGADGILLEESSADEEGHAGLELDARQTAEIRQIFLATLPDYLEPMRQMVARLSEDTSDESRGALAKTIVSIGEAASRVQLVDVARAMEALREDVMLLGDADEPQDVLRARISSALDAMDALAGRDTESAHANPHGRETIVSVREIGLDAAALQRLVAAGVVYVDQLLEADPKDVVAVSGLAAATVAALVDALERRRASARSVQPAPVEEPPARESVEEPPLEESPPAPPVEVSRSTHAIRNVVDEELALHEMRGEALRRHLGGKELREEVAALERRCETLRATLAEVENRSAERAMVLWEAEVRTAQLERDRLAMVAELEKVKSRRATLQSEHRDAIGELRHLADDTASLSERVTQILGGQAGREP
jgi:hypothetical protein